MSENWEEAFDDRWNLRNEEILDPRIHSDDGITYKTISSNSSNNSIFHQSLYQYNSQPEMDQSECLGARETTESDSSQKIDSKSEPKKKSSLIKRAQNAIKSLMEDQPKNFCVGESEMKTQTFQSDIKPRTAMAYNTENGLAIGFINIAKKPTSSQKRVVIARIESTRSWMSMLITHSEHIVELLTATLKINNSRPKEHFNKIMDDEINDLIPKIKVLQTAMDDLQFLPKLMDEGLNHDANARNYFPIISLDMYQYIRYWLDYTMQKCRSTINLANSQQKLKSLIKRTHEVRSALSTNLELT